MNLIILLTFFLNVLDFGATGDGISNDYQSIQNAIDAAAIKGQKVYFPAGIYKIDQTLNLPGGVVLIGDGKGATSTSTPYNGSIIKNAGNTVTISISGQNASVRDLVIYDTDNAGADGGVEIIGDGSIVESITLSNLLISGFTDGYALKLNASNSGGVTYCSFYDIRIRHAKTGILIQEDSSSFVNSNSFYHGAISGGGFDYCLHIKGGNNNIFNGTVIEPFSSTYGHIVVESGEIIGNEIRVEGSSQPSNIPLIQFNSNTYNSKLSGIYSGGLTVDEGNNSIYLKSGKSLGYKNSDKNLFVNSGFKGIQSDGSIPFWEISGNNVITEILPPETLTGLNVLKFTIPAGVIAKLKPKDSFIPKTSNNPLFDHVNFGAYMKTSFGEAATTICKAPNGITTGNYHPGDGMWHMIGMTSKVDKSTNSSYDPIFYLNNSLGTSPIAVYVTSPTLSFGQSEVSTSPGAITTDGGIMTGTISYGMISVNSPPLGFLILPKEGNIFEVNGTSTISRINYNAIDRFPRGTIITLLFNDAGLGVANSAYIKLKNNFSSSANSSLSLISFGDGTWREMNRNN